MTDASECRESRGFRFASALALLALFVAVAGIALGAGSAAAGDNTAVVGFEPDELSVEPGDTVDVDVTLRSHGDPFGSGVGTIELRLDYPTDYLTVTAIEPGSWFDEAPDGDQIGEGQSDTEVRERIVYADGNGSALFEQSLANPEFGVIGAATVATVTVEVSEDADAATARLAGNGTQVYPTRSQRSQEIAALPAEFHVDGGGDVVEPAFVDDPFVGVDEEGSDTGSDDDEDGADDDGTATSDEDDEQTSDEGYGADENDSTAADPADDEANDDVPAPLGAVVLGVLLAAFGLRRRAR